MPYSDENDPNLPDRVKELSEIKRRAWVAAFNSRMKACMEESDDQDKCEGSAFAVANSAAEKAGEKSRSAKAEEGLYERARRIGDAFSGEGAHTAMPVANAYVDEVFDGYVVICADGKFFRVEYSESGEEISFADRSTWVEVERKQEWIEKAANRAVLLSFGSPVKALGDGRIGGHLVLFSGVSDPDLDREFFTRQTDFDLAPGKTSAVYYNHGLDPYVGIRRIGRGPLKLDDVGVWIESQLALRDEYERAIYGLVEKNALGWSSGTAPNLIERVPSGKSTWIKSWPLGLDASLTPIPAEPRTRAIPLKAYLQSTKSLRELLEGVGKTPEPILRWDPEVRSEVARIVAETVAGTYRGSWSPARRGKE